MAFYPGKPADSDAIRLGAGQIRENFKAVVNDGIVVAKPPIYGEGAPEDSLGANFECYVDTLTGNEYVKVSGVWILSVDLHELYAVKSELIDTQNNLANLAAEVAAIETGNGTGNGSVGTASRYECEMYPANGVQNQGSYYWKDSAGHVTVTMRFNSSFGASISMNSTAAIVMPSGFRPAFTCYAPCFAENEDWNTTPVKCGYMCIDTDGYISVRFPIVNFNGDDFVCGQISYYAE